MAKDPHGRFKIIGFHMFDEFFKQVFLPEDDIWITYMSTVFVLRDSVALVASKCGELWERDGKRVKDPWVKKYSIIPTLLRRYALGFRENGELFHLRDKDHRLVSYNLDTQEIEEFHDAYDDPRSIDFQVLFYTENLVSIIDYNSSTDSWRVVHIAVPKDVYLGLTTIFALG
ncbi:uncharacterized protein LOC131304543 [Rhododendron vialii]|uniref:uncharacterized protein LOC131304543 n=1 Tax=Rhododendron vialii TaxID=182163 RepID=UPI00265DF079|nr:uncharacterized protein LOC131304543 [Rhododendron vialii]